MKKLIATFFTVALLGSSAAGADPVEVGAHIGGVGAGVGIGGNGVGVGAHVGHVGAGVGVHVHPDHRRCSSWGWRSHQRYCRRW
jgi:hypothetical protein